MEKAPSIDLWIKRIVWLSAAAFLGASCFFVWRISMVAYRIETTIRTTSGDIKQGTGTAAAISRRVDAIDHKIKTLEEKTLDVIPLEEVSQALDDLAEIRGQPDTASGLLDGPTEREIKYLFRYISRSGLRFEYSGKTRSALKFRVLLYAKYKVYRRVVGTTEEFLAKVATKTPGGNTYYVLTSDGKKRELHDWLSEALAQYREGQAKTSPAEAPE